MTNVERYWIEYHEASEDVAEELAFENFKAACAEEGVSVSDAIYEMDVRYPALEIQERVTAARRLTRPT